jgi:hypothetical protein
MARKDNEGLGVTFKIGPGQKLMKDSMEGPLYVGPKKKEAAAPKPKAKPEAKKPEVKMPKRPVSPTPYSKPDALRFNPLTSTTVNSDGSVESGAKGVGAKNYGDLSKPEEKPPGKRFNPLTSTYYKNGGCVRGDGVSRVRTKGKLL